MQTDIFMMLLWLAYEMFIVIVHVRFISLHARLNIDILQRVTRSSPLRVLWSVVGQR